MHCFSCKGRCGRKTHSSSVHMAQRQKSIRKESTTFYSGSSSKRLGLISLQKGMVRNANHILPCRSCLCFSLRQCKCVFSWHVKSHTRFLFLKFALTNRFYTDWLHAPRMCAYIYTYTCIQQPFIHISFKAIYSRNICLPQPCLYILLQCIND